MTRDEVKALYAALRVTYPNTYKKQEPDEARLLLDLWSAVLEPYPAPKIMNALKHFIQTSRTGFPPDLGDLIDDAVPEPDVMNGETAWQLVRQNAKCNPATSRNNFMNLPKDIQDALGGWGELVRIGNANIENDLPWIRREFIKNYSDVLEGNKRRLKQGVISLEYCEASNQLPGDQMLDMPKLPESKTYRIGD